MLTAARHFQVDAHHLIEFNEQGSPLVCTPFQRPAHATDTRSYMNKNAEPLKKPGTESNQPSSLK